MKRAIRILFPSKPFYSLQQVEVVRDFLEKEGFLVECPLEKVQPLQSPFGFYAHTVEERARDLIEAIENPNESIIWVFTGGAGCVEIVDFLEIINYSPKGLKPKLLIGFSDATHLHALWKKWGWSSFHGPDVGLCLETDSLTEIGINKKTSLKTVTNLLKERLNSIDYQLEALFWPSSLRKVEAQAIYGGNAMIISDIQGTPTEFKEKGNFLFLESIKEDKVETMRCLVSLCRTKLFRQVKGVIFGDLGMFKEPDPQAAAHECLKLFIKGHLLPHGIEIPVVYSPNFGHGDINEILPFGFPAFLEKVSQKGRLVIDLSQQKNL